jgi:hypothetical protein
VADIFISYAREDCDTASALAHSLATQGWSIFWDRTIRVGESFDRVIEREMDLARCVVVLWSRYSVDSDWVRSEAREGLRRKILQPALIGPVRPPLEFRGLQTADLADWQSTKPHAEYERLLADIALTITGHAPDEARKGQQGGTTVKVDGATLWELVLSHKALLASAVMAAIVLVSVVVFVAPGLRQPDSPATQPTGVEAQPSGPDAGLPKLPEPDAGPAPPEPDKNSPVKRPATPRKSPVAPADEKQPVNPPPRDPVQPGPNEPSAEPSRPPVEKEPGPAPPPPTNSEPVPEPDRESVESALSDYEKAFSSGDLDAVRRVFPGVSDRELKEVAALKVNTSNYRMVVTPTDIRIVQREGGPQAIVECQVFHNWIDDSGKPQSHRRPETLRFEWTGKTWVRVR